MTQAIQPASMTASLPTFVAAGSAASIPGSPAPADTMQALIPVLQGLVSVVSQLIGVLSAQVAGQIVQSGCTLATTSGGGDSVAAAVAVQPAASDIQQPAIAQPSAQPVAVAPAPTSVVVYQPVTGIPPGTSSMTGVGSPPDVVAGGANAAPSPAVTIGSQYLYGIPQTGGIVDLIVRSAQTSAPPAMNEGKYMWLMDDVGAGIYAHVHGFWGQYPEQITSGIQSGKIAVHLHADGSVHLHDVSY